MNINLVGGDLIPASAASTSTCSGAAAWREGPRHAGEEPYQIGASTHPGPWPLGASGFHVQRAGKSVAPLATRIPGWAASFGYRQPHPARDDRIPASHQQETARRPTRHPDLTEKDHEHDQPFAQFARACASGRPSRGGLSPRPSPPDSPRCSYRPSSAVALAFQDRRDLEVRRPWPCLVLEQLLHVRTHRQPVRMHQHADSARTTREHDWTPSCQALHRLPAWWTAAAEPQRTPTSCSPWNFSRSMGKPNMAAPAGAWVLLRTDWSDARRPKPTNARRSDGSAHPGPAGTHRRSGSSRRAASPVSA